MSSNHIKNIAIVGAGGQSGKYIAEALIASGRFTVTAITRPDSTSEMPAGLDSIAKVDYNDVSSLVSALKGQDCLIITMSVFAPPDSSKKLIEAAAEANIAWVMPNEWGGDYKDPVVAREALTGEGVLAGRKLVSELGKSNYLAFVCSFWYEYSLTAGPWSFGFDWDNKKVTFFDKGETKINATTWPKVGAGVVALLSLPIHREGDTKGPVLDDYKNECVYVTSFRLTQKEMFESLLRVTGDKESDWTISYEDPQERYANGMKLLQQGQRVGFGTCLYTRMFYDGAPGDYTGRGHDDNGVLGLEQEDLDARTKVAVEKYKKDGMMRM